MIHIAEGWRDYVLLDAGDGEKLEIWGKVKVVRPDPQAFWPRSYVWEKPDMRYHRSKAGGGTWEILGKNVPQAWKIGYDLAGGETLRFHVRPTGFKHMGLFPEQAVNWRWMAEKIRGARAQGRPVKVLNLFAYTGGATLACLKAGAEVTHVDAAKGMNQQARDNIALSGLSAERHRVLTDDVLKFVRREARRGNMYDGIIMDPPVFGRGPGGEMWKLEEKLFELVKACALLLSPEPLFMQINTYTAGFSPAAYGNILNLIVPPRDVTVGEIGLAAESGIVLPCGMYARWEA
ncbi:MAG: class I SAM-dependent methyltransferase [Defluviitaleaceae bacterium]|nr:class I SAM-dependent methyltransferase [Defluviitaleaceae bacterium]